MAINLKFWIFDASYSDISLPLSPSKVKIANGYWAELELRKGMFSLLTSRVTLRLEKLICPGWEMRSAAAETRLLKLVLNEAGKHRCRLCVAGAPACIAEMGNNMICIYTDEE